MPLIVVPAGSTAAIDSPGGYFQVRAANQGFTLKMEDKRGRGKDFSCEEGDEIEREFVSCVIDNTQNTDDLKLVYNINDTPIRSRANRVPPTQMNPFGVKTFTNANDVAGPFGGMDTSGRRRLEVFFQIVRPDGVHRIGIYKASSLAECTDANQVGELDYYNRTWNRVTDFKVTLKMIAASVGAVNVVGGEVNMLP